MSKKKKDAQPEQFEQVESVLTRTEQFIENNQKTITTIVLAIIIVVGAYLLFNRYYMKPMESEARSQMFRAEQYFAQDSFNLALNGDGNYLGFKDIIEEYGITKSANLAHYYAGISNLHLGNYDQAIEHLEDFNVNGKIIEPEKYGALGNAYLEKGNQEEALDYFEKAMNADDNAFTTPLYMSKAAYVYEKQGEYKEAIELYQQIKRKYPNSTPSQDADKNIARLKVLANRS
ncbi:MAG TPA: tetratricopeptide repeat protein [Bacteroidales bacterium]|nr:tetratricopeptide repeat protein [Bacteroidales bacterium]